MTGKLDTVVVRAPAKSGASLTLLCLGFCGGGTASYLRWADVMPEDVLLAAVCYPGREGRFAEPFARDWDELAEDATAAVLAAADQPYVLFGHSMGGWAAFDVTVRIKQLGGPTPEALIVSSANPPSDGVQKRDMFPAQHETDEQLLDWMRISGLLPPFVLDEPDLRAMAVELMRADMRVRDSFSCRNGTRVSVPVHLLTGAADDVIDPHATRKWRAHATGEFRHDTLPGGHFFTPDVWSNLPAYMAHLTR